VVTKLGGTVDDSELVPGAVFDHKAAKTAGGPTRVENAKIALVQFHISPPKTDLENNVIISDYAQARLSSATFAAVLCCKSSARVTLLMDAGMVRLYSSWASAIFATTMFSAEYGGGTST